MSLTICLICNHPLIDHDAIGCDWLIGEDDNPTTCGCSGEEAAS